MEIRTYDKTGTAGEERIEFVTDSVQELSRVLQSTTYKNGSVSESLTYVYGNGLLAQYESEEGASQADSTDGVASVNGEDNMEGKNVSYLYYHFNNVGSTMAVTASNGEVKYRYTYSPYGELLNGNYGQVLFLYNGQYGVTSDDNGLYYMRARYYNIDIKRFMNQDVITGEIKQSQSLNRYAYVEGNPVTYFDPFGLEKFDTSELHEGISKVGWSITGFELMIKALGLTASFSFLAQVGLVLTVVDGIIYVYDITHAESYEDEVNAKAGLASSGVSIIFSILPFKEDDVKDAINFTWSYVSDGASKLNQYLDDLHLWD